MKAIRVHQFGGPEVLRLEEVPDPKPGQGEILVRVHAAGVNPVDAYIRSGAYAVKPPLPYTPGSDAGGVVESIGEGVKSFKPGDRVYVAPPFAGTYAELAVAPERNVHRLPQRDSFAQGAALGVPYATACRALFQKANAKPGETVLVHGATGGVGIAAIQLARAAGLTVLGTGGTPEGRALAEKEGAHRVFDHTDPDYLKRLAETTGGQGVDLILEMLANKNLGQDLTILAPKGRVVVVGSRGTVEINPRDAMGRDATIYGMTLFNVTPPEMASIHALLIAGLENGSLQPVIGKELPLAQAAQAHEEIMKPGAKGKIVLIP
jgi:NADPH:quinone reductase